jgi:hypothetical protein
MQGQTKANHKTNAWLNLHFSRVSEYMIDSLDQVRWHGTAKQNSQVQSNKCNKPPTAAILLILILLILLLFYLSVSAKETQLYRCLLKFSINR